MTRNDKKQAQLNTDFTRTLSLKYEYYCRRHEIEPSHQGFIKYLMLHNLIDQNTANHYMVLEWYPDELYKNDGCKTKAVHELEDRTPLQERSIWYIIGKKARAFFPGKSVYFGG